MQKDELSQKTDSENQEEKKPLKNKTKPLKEEKIENYQKEKKQDKEMTGDKGRGGLRSVFSQMVLCAINALLETHEQKLEDL